MLIACSEAVCIAGLEVVIIRFHLVDGGNAKCVVG